MRLRKDAKVELLQGLPLFAECSKRDLGEISGIADEIDLKEGREVTKQGRSGREFFVLVEGTVDVLKNNRKVATLKAGDFFGEIALFYNGPRTATVRTTSPARALVLTRRDFGRLLKEQPDIQSKVLTALAERLAPSTL